MGQIGNFGGQDFNLFVNGFVFVHDEHIPAFDGAQATFYLDAGRSQILFGNGHRQFFSQILEFLIYLFWFHIAFGDIQILKKPTLVLYLHHINNISAAMLMML